MARCLPYPPPSFEASIESFKLHKESEKARAEKKGRKREKENGEKKSKQKQAGKIVVSDQKTHQGQRSISYSRKNDIQKGKEVDQSERSDISEELGPPYCSQKLCYSSDSTQNSDILRQTLPSYGSCSRVGNKLRIRLKRKEPDAPPKEEQVFSTYGQHDVSIRQIHEIAHHPIRGVQFQLKQNEPGASMRVKQPCSTSGQSDIHAEQKHGIAQRPNQNPLCSAAVSGVSSKGLTGASLRVEQPCFTSGWTDIHAEQKYGIAHRLSQDPPYTSGQSAACAEQKHGIAQRLNQNPPWSAVVSGVSSKGLTSASLRVEQPCFSYGRTNIHAEREYGIAHRPSQDPPCSAVGTGVSSKGLTSKFEKEQHHSVAAHAEAASETVSKMEGPESPYQALIENWIPPKLQFERTDSDNLEWLFDRKHQNGKIAKVAKVECAFTGCAGTWPCANFLPEADIHVLPFIVPF